MMGLLMVTEKTRKNNANSNATDRKAEMLCMDKRVSEWPAIYMAMLWVMEHPNDDADDNSDDAT